MVSSVIFIKTAKGQAEITARSDALTHRQRRVLIMVDGKRTVSELSTLLQAADLQQTIGMLEEEGHIVSAGQHSTGAVRPVAPEDLPADPAFRTLPTPPKAQELEMARNFIINSLRSLHGHYANLSIITDATAATSHDELRQQFSHWLHAVIQTREGKRQADEWCRRLLEVI